MSESKRHPEQIAKYEERHAKFAELLLKDEPWWKRMLLRFFVL